MSIPVLRVAAKAVILNDGGKILILREAATNPSGNHPGKYHLPGGRLEPGESFHDALRREIQEETGITDITVQYPVHVDEWRPTIQGEPTQIVGMFIFCRTTATDVVLSNEHDEQHWIDPAEYNSYDLLEAERKAIQAYLAHPANS